MPSAAYAELNTFEFVPCEYVLPTMLIVASERIHNLTAYYADSWPRLRCFSLRSRQARETERFTTMNQLL